MSDEQSCFVCGQPIDNADGTGYCTRCSADVGVYAQRSASPLEETSDVTLSIDYLREDVAVVLQRLEQVEAKLALAEQRLTLLEGRRQTEWRASSCRPAAD